VSITHAVIDTVHLGQGGFAVFGIPIPKSVLIGAAVVGAVYLYGSQISDNAHITPLFGSGCEMRVNADILNVRSGPSADQPIVGMARFGESIGATKDKQGGYRKLGEGRWAANDFLNVNPGSDCG
jgi:uncharacterized protein YgiM (DUF1202 family)